MANAEKVTALDWTQRLARRKNGDPYPDERNIKIALEQSPELKGLFRYDEFADQVELTRPPPGVRRDELDKLFNDDEPTRLADVHVTALTIYLSQHGFVGLHSHVVQDTVVLFARAYSIHPVRAYLEAAHAAWDGKPRLDTWLASYLGATDNADYLRDVGSKFAIGAVARILNPGCQMDSILVLEGEQGEGKSRAVRTLGREWTADLSGDLGDKDAAISLQRIWIAELAELTALRRSEQEPIKAFISRRVDHYRPPYGRNTVTRPRHTVFIATTNENDYLQDPTGARRYWPVACGAICLSILERDVDQLWGEAVTRYLAREPWHLDKSQTIRAQTEQASRQRLSVVDESVIQYLERQVNSGTLKVEMRVLLREVFDVTSSEDPHKAAGLGAISARVLAREGWKRLKPTGRGTHRVQAYAKLGSQSSQSSQSRNGEVAESKVTEIVTSSQSSQSVQSENEEYTDDIPF